MGLDRMFTVNRMIQRMLHSGVLRVLSVGFTIGGSY